ncbi:MAG: DUF2156 domain-containing protein [Frankiales bacterium]|nr:DUF2156 domain-containing protein [Frankiales bacterium]
MRGQQGERGHNAVGVVFARVGAGVGEHREIVAVVVALFASLLALRGWRASAHGDVEVGVGLLLIARAVAIGRPLVRANIAWSLALVVLARFASTTGHSASSWAFVIGAGAVAGFPRRAPGASDAEDRRHVWALVDRTPGDTLAPFAMRTDKAYVFTPDRTAAVAYRVRFGVAIASGDPVGSPMAREAAVDAFIEHAEANGWRTAVLGASDRMVEVWRARGLRAVPIGRDVIIDVGRFSLDGRAFRNLRQAVQRTRNAGVTTEIVPERSLTADLRAELEQVMRRTGKGEQSRGFAMILDHVLDGTHPGTFIALARDRDGQVVAFQRYATADGGRDLSLDVPWRIPGAPNGVDERLIVDVVSWASEGRAGQVSLAFAAFPELFSATERSLPLQAAYRAVRLLDRFIKLESLYRFVRKFHSFGSQRFIALRPMQVVWVALAALTLEFGTTAKRQR